MSDEIVRPKGTSMGETFVAPIGLFDVDGYPVETAEQVRAYIGNLFAEFMALYPDDPMTLTEALLRFAPIDSQGNAGAVASVDGRVGPVELTDVYDPRGAGEAAQANAQQFAANRDQILFDLVTQDIINRVANEATLRANGDAAVQSAFATELTRIATGAGIVGDPGPKGDKGDPGEPGPKGDTGASGISGVVYSQPETAGTWTIPHSIGRFPDVVVYDLTGNRVEPDISVSDTSVSIMFSAPTAGKAILL